MSNDSAHKSRWQIGEIVFGVPFLVALALQWFVPLAFPRGLLTPAEILGGAVFINYGRGPHCSGAPGVCEA